MIYLATDKHDHAEIVSSFRGLYGGDIMLEGTSKISLDVLRGLKRRREIFGITHAGNYYGGLSVASLARHRNGTWSARIVGRK